MLSSDVTASMVVNDSDVIYKRTNEIVRVPRL